MKRFACLVLALSVLPLAGCKTVSSPWEELELHGKVGQVFGGTSLVVGVPLDIVCAPVTFAVGVSIPIRSTGDASIGEALGNMAGSLSAPGIVVQHAAYVIGATVSYPVYLGAVVMPRRVRSLLMDREEAEEAYLARAPRLSRWEYGRLRRLAGRQFAAPYADSRLPSGPFDYGYVFGFGLKPQTSRRLIDEWRFWVESGRPTGAQEAAEAVAFWAASSLQFAPGSADPSAAPMLRDALVTLAEAKGNKAQLPAALLDAPVEFLSRAPVPRSPFTFERTNALCDAIRATGHPGPIEALVRLSRDPNALMRSGAIRALARIGGQTAFEAVLEAIGDPDDRAAALAADSLPEIDEGQALPRLRELLAGVDEARSIAAAKALGRLKGSKQAEVALIGALADARSEVRAAAVRALAQSASQTRADAVATVLTDSDPTVATAAAQSLGEMGGKPAVDALGRFLLSGSSAAPGTNGERAEVGDEAIKALGKIGTREAGDVLLRLLQDEDSAPAAATALAEANDRRAVGPLVQLVQQHGGGAFVAPLQKLTGRSYGSDTEGWAEWWQRNRQRYERGNND